MMVVTTKQMHAYIPTSYIVPIMYCMIFGIGIARGFFSPTSFSIMASIVPKNYIQIRVHGIAPAGKWPLFWAQLPVD